VWYNSPMNEIATAQTNSFKLEVLRSYFSLIDGKRPTAEVLAAKYGMSVSTIRSWIKDNSNAELLEEITPVWQNVGSGRQFATDHLPEALQVIVDTMRTSKSEKLRMDAAAMILQLAGVKAPTGKEEEKADGEAKRPAVLLNLFLGGTGEPVQIVDGKVREIRVEKPEVMELEEGS
jgi:hypothetical protein